MESLSHNLSCLQETLVLLPIPNIFQFRKGRKVEKLLARLLCGIFTLNCSRVNEYLKSSCSNKLQSSFGLPMANSSFRYV